MIAVEIALLPGGRARAESLVCTCQAPTCGNGVTGGSQGKVYSDVPALSAERMFGPSRTGAEKTGWVCKAMDGPPPSVTLKDLYTCTCTQSRCGGGDIMPGVLNERQELLSKGLVGATFRGYVCRCQELLGCGAGGAPYAKRGETREGVPAAHINNLYHSDTCGGWVCSTK